MRLQLFCYFILTALNIIVEAQNSKFWRRSHATSYEPKPKPQPTLIHILQSSDYYPSNKTYLTTTSKSLKSNKQYYRVKGESAIIDVKVKSAKSNLLFEFDENATIFIEIKDDNTLLASQNDRNSTQAQTSFEPLLQGEVVDVESVEDFSVTISECQTIQNCKPQLIPGIGLKNVCRKQLVCG